MKGGAKKLEQMAATQDYMHRLPGRQGLSTVLAEWHTEDWVAKGLVRRCVDNPPMLQLQLPGEELVSLAAWHYVHGHNRLNM